MRPPNTMRLLSMILLCLSMSACGAGSTDSAIQNTQVYTQDDVIGATETERQTAQHGAWADDVAVVNHHTHRDESYNQPVNALPKDSIGNLIKEKAASTPRKSNTSSNLSIDGFGLRKVKHADILLTAEQHASPAGQTLLAMARKMALEDKDIVRGACWDYINELWIRSGYPANQRKHIFKGTYAGGPFADASQFEAGDWLYYINHSYNDIEHSAMFIGWVDEPQKIGLMLTYGGESRAEPARFREYDLSHVYTIVRAVD